MACNVLLDGEGVAVLQACGEMRVPVCKCGHWSELLCDFPVGKGKTCDLALCPCCGSPVGEDYDLCAIHRAMFDERAVVGEIRLWPPRKASAIAPLN